MRDDRIRDVASIRIENADHNDELVPGRTDGFGDLSGKWHVDNGLMAYDYEF